MVERQNGDSRDSSGAAESARKPRSGNRLWVWFFIVVGTLAVAAVATEIWSNERQQLTAEKLAAARAFWQEKGPHDYALKYEIKRDDDPDPAPRAGEKYMVLVRGGKVESVADSDGRAPRLGDFEFGTMDDLFDRIAERLRADRESGGPRPFVKATFDPADGHVIHYVHSVMRTRERLEVTVTLRPLTASSP
jgi:hypothetical protein